MYTPIASKVEKMFSGIAKKYDLLNHILSLGIDYYWRHVLVKKATKCNPKKILDLATGSGDVAFKLAKSLKNDVSITAVDFCQPMLNLAIKKQEKISNMDNINFIQGDALNLDYGDNYYDVVTIAFGVRNFEDRNKGLREIERVLKPGGSLFILEFSQPATCFRPIYFIYLKYLLPMIAGIISKDKNAYKYLAGTIESFPTKAILSEQLLQAGFKQSNAIGLTFSIVSIHQAIKAI